MRRVVETVQVTIDFDTRELKHDGKKYVINWFNEEYKDITADKVCYAVESFAQAVNDIVVLKALNPFIKNINLKVI